MSSRPPLPETVLVPRIEMPPTARPDARRRPRGPWWLPTAGEAAVGLLYVACGFVMVLVFVAMLGN